MDRDIIAMIFNENSGLHEHQILEQNKDSVKLRITLQDYVRNRNFRKYSKEVLTEALQQPHIKELKERKSWYGECGHPMEPNLSRQMALDLNNASHKILEYYVLDETIEADIETTHFDIGKTMRDEIVKGGTQTAYSMRGAGPIKKDGNKIDVQMGLRILTYDWVVFPSHKIAYQKYVIREQANLAMYHNGSNDCLSESMIVPISEDMLIKSLNESENFKVIHNEMEIDLTKSSLFFNESANMIILQTDKIGIAIKPEKLLRSNQQYLKYMRDMGR